MMLGANAIASRRLIAKKHIATEDLAGFTRIEQGAFMCSRIERIDIPDSIVELGIHSFARCHNLHTIIMPRNLNQDLSKVFRVSGFRVECKSLRLIVTELELDFNLLGIYSDCNIFTHEEFFNGYKGDSFDYQLRKRGFIVKGEELIFVSPELDRLGIQ